MPDGNPGAARMISSLPRGVADFVRALTVAEPVVAVRLGGSRGGETAQPQDGSRDWDLLVYMQGALEDLSRAEVPGLTDVTPIASPFIVGECVIEANRDVMDCAFIHVTMLAQSARSSASGEFRLHPMVRAAAGMPSYVLEAEAALSVPLSGAVDVAAEPPATLVAAGVPWWRGRAALALHMAEDSLYLGDAATTAGFVAATAACLAHAEALADGWYLPSKRFLAHGRDPLLAHALRAALGADRLASARSLRDFGAERGLTREAALQWAADGREEGPWSPRS